MAQAYSTISNREPNEDISAEGISNELDDGDDLNPSSSDPLPAAANPAIKAAILASQAKAAAPIGAPAIDPLLADYNQKQQQLDATRQAQDRSNTISNIGQALSQVAQGANTPTPNTDLYKNIEDQNKVASKSAEEDMDRRQRVFNMIEQRKSREQMHDDSLASREQIASDSQANRAESAKTRQAQVDLANNARNDRLSTANIRAANGLFQNNNIQSLATQLTSASSAQALLDDINSGKLTDSKNVSTQLTNLLAKIELGTPGGEADRRAMGVDTLYGSVQGLLSKLSGQPMSTIPAGYLTQLSNEANALGDRAAKNYKGITDSQLAGADLSGGNPEANPGQVHTLAKQRQSSFLKQMGYNPDTAQRLNHSTSSSESSGVVRMQAPDGTIRLVPSDQVEQALQNGGKKV